MHRTRSEYLLVCDAKVDGLCAIPNCDDKKDKNLDAIKNILLSRSETIKGLRKAFRMAYEKKYLHYTILFLCIGGRCTRANSSEQTLYRFATVSFRGFGGHTSSGYGIAKCRTEVY